MAVEAIDGVRPETRRAIAAAVDRGGVVTSTDLPYPGKRQVCERERERGNVGEPAQAGWLAMVEAKHAPH